MGVPLQIIIASFNRPKYLIRAIESILGQSFINFELLISDNSTDNRVQEAMKAFSDERLKYKRRLPSMEPIDHLNAIIDDVTSEKFMIFHDDDIMYKNMVETLFMTLEHYPDCIAVGANAYLNINGKTTKKSFLKVDTIEYVINGRNEMATKYLQKNGIVPFPSYMYKKEVSSKIRMNIQDGGKYCDVSFIMNVSDLGRVIFLATPLMEYYIHPGQDSKTNDFIQRIKLVNYIVSTTHYNKNDMLIKELRLLNIYSELKFILLNNLNISFKRYSKIINLLFRISPFDYFLKSLLLVVYTRFAKRNNKRII